MTTTPSPENEPRNDETRDDIPLDPLDQGLAEAFGKDAVRPPTDSVLAALESRAQSSLGLHIDSPANDGTPVRVTEEAKALRDPRGRYLVLGEVGRGGVGVVYRGRDQDLGRDVAMKVLRDDHANNPEVLARFVEEAQIGGQLQHPGIVPVYELGLQSGERPYFAMKLVKGETLSAQINRRSDPNEDRRRYYGIFEQICQTMAYAHSRQVVHRDLKPANVMIGAFGEVQIVDWGFAKVLEAGGNADERASMRADSQRSVIATVRSQPGSGTQSVVGSMLGTPAYMPPEQALGDLDNVDARSDVFGLGAILCEILTGAPPYRAADGDVIHQAATGDLSKAHERIRQSSADEAVVTLCIECLSRSQAARPKNAQQVADRISAHLTSVEERAQAAVLAAAEARFKQRTTLAVCSAALLMILTGLGAWAWIAADQREQAAAANQRVAAATSGASEALGRAQEARLDLELWSIAEREAQHLATFANDESVAPEMKQAAADLQATIRTEQSAAAAAAARRDRDEQMLARLIKLRMPTGDELRLDHWADDEHRRLDAAYRDAFAFYLQKPLEETTTEAALSTLKQSGIAVELAAALDHLCVIRDELPEQQDLQAATTRFRAIAALLDGDNKWRNELRSLLPNAGQQAERLRDLAARVDPAELTPTNFLVLAHALHDANARDDNVRLLQTGLNRYPNDFGLAFALSVRQVQLDRPDWHAAVTTLDVARAIAPDEDEVLHRQGIALAQLKRHRDAEGVFRKLIERNPEDAHWHVHLGEVLFESGRVEEGLAKYREALTLEPENAAVIHLVGIAQAALGDAEASMASIQRALALDDQHSAAHNSLATRQLDEGLIDESIASLRTAIAIAPRDARLHTSLGNALTKAAKFDEARASFLAALQFDPFYASAHAGLGSVFSITGDNEAAIERLRRAVECDPSDPLYHNNLGATLMATEQFDDALASFEQAQKALAQQRRPLGRVDAATVHLNIGKTHAAVRNNPKAIASLRRAIDANSELGEAHSLLGECLRAQGKISAAIASLNRSLQLNPKNARSLSSLAGIYAAQRRLKDAIPLQRRATQASPEEWIHQHNLAFMLSQDGKLGEAVASYRRATELAPDAVAPHANLAHSQLALNKVDDAIKTFQRTIVLAPDDAKAHYQLGTAWLRSDDFDKAITCFERALKLDATLAKSVAVSGSRLSRRNKPTAALRCYQTALATGFESADTLVALGKLHHKQGDVDAALESLQAALAIDPKHTNAHTAMGNLRKGQKQYDDARTSFERAIALDDTQAGHHFNLGNLLATSGQFDDAIPPMEKARDLWSADKAGAVWARRAEQSLRSIKQQAAQSRELLEIVRGERSAESPEEWRLACRVATNHDQLRACADTYERMFAAVPEAQTGHLDTFNAAVAAVRAAAGEGKFAASLQPKDRSELRAKALAWLMKTLVSERKALAESTPIAPQVRKLLRIWQTTPSLESVRSQEALFALPEDQALSWLAFWHQVTDALGDEG